MDRKRKANNRRRLQCCVVVLRFDDGDAKRFPIVKGKRNGEALFCCEGGGETKVKATEKVFKAVSDEIWIICGRD